MKRMSDVVGKGQRRGSLWRVFALVAGLVLGACASQPPYAGLGANELFDWALEHYEEEEWEDATEAFERFIASHPTHARRAEAQYLLARSFLEQGEHLTAVSEFDRFLQRWPVHALTPQASLGVCEAYAALSPIPQRDQTYTQRARDACARTVSEFPNHEITPEAVAVRDQMTERLAEREYQVGRFYQRRDLHDSAILSFERILEQYADTEWAPRALLEMYHSYQAIGWNQEAEETREELLSLFPDSAEAREVQSDRDGR